MNNIASFATNVWSVLLSPLMLFIEPSWTLWSEFSYQDVNIFIFRNFNPSKEPSSTHKAGQLKAQICWMHEMIIELKNSLQSEKFNLPQYSDFDSKQQLVMVIEYMQS